MLDPRIYRAGFVAVALAVVVVAFSLVDPQGPLGSSLTPEAFSGENAAAVAESLNREAPDHRPGAAGDERVAAAVAGRLRHLGFRVSTTRFSARTALGTRNLENVVATRTGLAPGSIVVVSHRDSLRVRSPAAELSGTAALLELARVLAGETQHRSIVLVSTSGSAGLAGATQLARTLPGPVDAVIALDDMVAARRDRPVVVPWSGRPVLAPPLLRDTLSAALSGQGSTSPGAPGVAGQLARLAFPWTLTEQGPFDAAGIPAVTLSMSGEADGPSGERIGPVSPARVTASGRAVLQTVTALDAGPQVPRPGTYLLYAGKVVPGWAIKLLVLALVVPVLLAAVDGLARARRRGHRVLAGLPRVLACAVPFALVVLLALVARWTGLLHAAPPGAVGAGQVVLDGRGIAVLAVLAIVLALATWLVHHTLLRAPAAEGDTPGELDGGRSMATLIVLALTVVALWVLNPFAALAAIPALHLWLWLLDPDLRPHRALALVLVGAGLLAPVLIVVHLASSVGLSPAQVPWNGLLLLAGGETGIAFPAILCLLLGCLLAVASIAAQAARRPRLHEVPVTVRGPVTYAGPGSLGGTESALRR